MFQILISNWTKKLSNKSSDLVTTNGGEVVKIRFSAAAEYCTECRWNLNHQVWIAAVKRSEEETAPTERGNGLSIVSASSAVLAHVRLFVIRLYTLIEAGRWKEKN